MNKSRNFIVYSVLCASVLLLLTVFIFSRMLSNSRIEYRISTNTPVSSMAISSAGWFVSGHNNGKLAKWATLDGRQVYELQAHSGPIYAIAIDPFSAFIATGGNDGFVRLWNADTGKVVGETNFPDIHFSPSVQIIDQQGTENIVKFAIYSIDFSTDGSRVAVGGIDGRVIVLDSQTLNTIHSFQAHFLHNSYREVNSVDFNKDSDLLASGGGDGSVYLWNMNTGAEFGQIAESATNTRILKIAFTLNGSGVVVGRANDHVEVWSAANNNIVSEVASGRSETYSIDFALAKNLYVSGGGGVISEYDGIPFLSPKKDLRISVSSINTNNTIITLPDKARLYNIVAIDTSAKFVISGDASGNIRKWSLGN